MARRLLFPLLVTILSLALSFSACTQKGSHSEHSKDDASIVYTCPMHPQIRQNTPGRCPICGMDLVKVAPPAPAGSPKPEEKTATPKGHTGFHLNFAREQLIGVKVGKVDRRELFREIRAPGRVAFDPDLYTAQTEYLEALRQLERVKDSPLADVKHSALRMIESSKLRLKILGLADKQIAELPKRENKEPSLLLNRPGEDVWVYAEVYEMDLAHIRPGLEAEISATFLEGTRLSGRVVSVDRVINTATRTAKVRITLPKARLTLRPETYVDVSFNVSLGEQIAVPFDAVLDSGTESWVFIKRPYAGSDNGYEPRLITPRFSAGDWIAVESGLKEGETIVTSANFLIDSESRLRAVTND